MVVTNEEIANKIVYLKKNGFKPNLQNESLEVQCMIKSFYNCEKTNSRGKDVIDEDPFWFRLTFCNYEVTDELVHEINREYKRCLIKNIAKDEIFE